MPDGAISIGICLKRVKVTLILAAQATKVPEMDSITSLQDIPEHQQCND